MKRLGVAIFMGVTLTGCSPKVVNTIEYRDRVEYINQYVRDTIHESVTEYIYSKNDTIFQTRTKIIYKERLTLDTIYKERVDSIPYAVEVPVYIEKPLKDWQKGMIGVGIVSVFLFLLALAIKFKGL